MKAYLPIKDELEQKMKVPFEELMSDLKHKFLNDEEGLHEMHKKNMIETAFNGNPYINSITKALLKMKFTIGVASGDDYFITSDNPGYTYYTDMNGNEQVYNLKFEGNFHGIRFPMTSKLKLMVSNVDPQGEDLVTKDIRYVKIDTQKVNFLNIQTARMTSESIFCENEKYLKAFVGYFKQYAQANNL